MNKKKDGQIREEERRRGSVYSKRKGEMRSRRRYKLLRDNMEMNKECKGGVDERGRKKKAKEGGSVKEERGGE